MESNPGLTVFYRISIHGGKAAKAFAIPLKVKELHLANDGNIVLSAVVDARMCMFHGECHDLSRSGKPVHRERCLREIIKWFDDRLKEDNNE